MRQITYIENQADKELIFNENESPDLPEFNKNLMSKKTEDLKYFKVQSKGQVVEIDLVNGDITIDGNKIDLQVDEQTKAKLNINNLRWINFNRKRVSYRMSGLRSEESVGYGIGWQAEVDGQNLKRYAFVTEEGHELIIE